MEREVSTLSVMKVKGKRNRASAGDHNGVSVCSVRARLLGVGLLLVLERSSSQISVGQRLAPGAVVAVMSTETSLSSPSAMVVRTCQVQTLWMPLTESRKVMTRQQPMPNLQPSLGERTRNEEMNGGLKMPPVPSWAPTRPHWWSKMG